MEAGNRTGAASPHVLNAPPAQLILQAVHEMGVEVFFGTPGGQNLPFYMALREMPSVRNLLARHEQSAAFMADGYYRISGRPAGVLLLPGPGVTNALTGIANAYADSAAMVVLAMNVRPRVPPGFAWSIHELRDQTAVLGGACSDVLTCGSLEEIPLALTSLARRLASGRPRPVCLEVPSWTLDEKAALSWEVSRTGGDFGPPSIPSETELAEATMALSTAQRPLLMAGWGVVCSGGEEAFRELAARLQAPTVTSVKGKGIVDPSAPNHLGCVWSAATRAAVAAYAPDIVLAVGTRLSGRTLAAGLLKVGDGLIQVDVDPTVPGRNLPCRLGLVGDAKATLQGILARLPPVPSGVSRLARPPGPKATDPQFDGRIRTFLRELEDGLGDDGVLVLDNTMLGYWAARLLPLRASRRWAFPMAFCPLGYALPGAIGASLARPGKVVAVLGDGGLMFTLPELSLAVEEGLPLPVVVLNDHGYGAIQANEEFRFGTRTVGVGMRTPRFAEMAASFGAVGVHLSGPEGIGREVRLARERSVPTVLEVEYDRPIPWAV